MVIDKQGVTKLFHAPINIHIKNIMNSMASLENTKVSNLEFDYEKEKSELKKCLLNLSTEKQINLTDECAIVTDMFNTLVDSLLATKTIKRLPDIEKSIIEMKNVVDCFCESKTVLDDYQYEEALEHFEETLENLDNANLRTLIYDLTEDDVVSEKVADSVDDIVTSIYGIMSAVSATIKWGDIIRDHAGLCEYIKQIE